MRYMLFAISLTLLAVTLFFRFYKKGNDNVDKQGGLNTMVYVQQKLIDVGDRIKNSPTSGRYVIVNNGRNSLFIEKVESDCHCTVGEYTKDAVKPNDSTVIILRYDSKILGVFQSSAVITLNAEQSPLLLILRGNIVDSLSH